jgi:sporulation protein YlmC with PRC-barrel domain
MKETSPMKKFMIPAISLAALAASGFAVAQTTEQPTQNQPTTEQCAANPQLAGCPGVTGNEPTQTQPTDQTQPSDMQGQDTTQQPTAEQPSVAEQPPVQAPADLTAAIDTSNAMLASNFIGSAVYSTTNENVGDINDVIFDSAGKVNAAVVGVGGFLGMGEKDVAVPLDKITMSKDESGANRFVISATREQLDAAPAFDKTRFTVSGQAAPAPVQ